MSEKKGEWIRDITPSDTRGVRMISRALTHGYPVTPEVRELIVEKLLEIVETSKCPRITMNAIKGLLAADKANIQLLAVANTLARDYFGGGSLQEQLAALENSQGLTPEYKLAMRNLLLVKAGQTPPELHQDTDDDEGDNDCIDGAVEAGPDQRIEGPLRSERPGPGSEPEGADPEAVHLEGVSSGEAVDGGSANSLSDQSSGRSSVRPKRHGRSVRASQKRREDG